MKKLSDRLNEMLYGPVRALKIDSICVGEPQEEKYYDMLSPGGSWVPPIYVHVKRAYTPVLIAATDIDSGVVYNGRYLAVAEAIPLKPGDSGIFPGDLLETLLDIGGREVHVRMKHSLPSRFVQYLTGGM